MNHDRNNELFCLSWTERAAAVFSSKAVPVIRPPHASLHDVWDNIIPPPAIGGRSGGKSVVFRFASTGRPCPLGPFRYSSVTHYPPSEFRVPPFWVSRNRFGVRAPVPFGHLCLPPFGHREYRRSSLAAGRPGGHRGLVPSTCR